MAKKLTPRLGLIQPDENEYYDVNDQNRNIAKIDEKAVIGSGVMQIKAVSQDEYTTTVHDPQTLYIVKSGSSVRMYLGDVLVVGWDGVPIAVLSQDEYDALESPDSQTLYVIRE